MSQTIVQVENLNLAYKNLRAVQNVSFSVESGEILAVIGQNGSGKTSTVECVEGLRKPDSGLIQVFGKDPWQRRGEVYREMGVQLQEADHKLSGGEKQRLSVLLSLIGRPKLLVLDELTTGLDPEVRQNMWISFENISKGGVTIIMVSHYLDEAEALADKILYLERGRQQFFGTKQGFREYVKSRIPQDKWEENLSLEKLYLMLAPKTTGLTMEGIL